METVTPKEINKVVDSFCGSISNNKAVYLELESESDSIILDCTENVQRKIKRDGGKVQYGWQVVITEPFLIEAQFHAVWLDTDNKMHDITPRQDDYKGEILFVPDPSIKYEDKQINNIRRALVKDKVVDDYNNICDRLFEATNRGNLALKNEPIIKIDLSPEHYNEIMILMIEKERLLSIINSKYT